MVIHQFEQVVASVALVVTGLTVVAFTLLLLFSMRSKLTRRRNVSSRLKYGVIQEGLISS